MIIWKGGAANYDSFRQSVGSGIGIVYQIDPELAGKLEAFIASGKEVAGWADTFIGGNDTEKGATLAAIVNAVINAYTGAIERAAAKSKSERDRKLSEARRKFIKKIIDDTLLWPYAILEVPHINISIKGEGMWTEGGDFSPAIYKPEEKSKTTFRYLRPGPTRDPTGCAADVPTIGSVEGTNSASCKGQIVIYALLYPCWREASLSFGAGEFIRSSDKDDPGAAMLDFQIRAVMEPETNLKITMSVVAKVVGQFEDRFWEAVEQRKKPRRDPYGVVGPGPPYDQKMQATRAGKLGDVAGYAKGGICGKLASPGATPDDGWASGLQVYAKRPKDPTLDQRFYFDENKIIHAIWNDKDLLTCGVLGAGNAWVYDSDTGNTARCTLASRNAVYANWLNLATARQFWATRDYVREAWKRGDFVVDAGALPLLEEGVTPVLGKRLVRGTFKARPVVPSDGAEGGAAIAAAAAVALWSFF